VEIARKIFFRTGARKMHNKNLLRICFLFSLFVLGSVLFFLTFFLVICFRFFFNKVVFSIPVFCSDLLSSGLPCRQFCYTFFYLTFFWCVSVLLQMWNPARPLIYMYTISRLWMLHRIIAKALHKVMCFTI